jgi:osmotically-inducible protein OsmY
MRYLLLPLLFCNSGCKREDIDILTRIGWKVTEKVQSLIPEQTPFGGNWTSLNTSIESRVKSRIQSDKFLSATPLEISSEGKSIRVKGIVKEDGLKRRALEMIEATIGVESVIDEIEVTP